MQSMHYSKDAYKMSSKNAADEGSVLFITSKKLGLA